MKLTTLALGALLSQASIAGVIPEVPKDCKDDLDLKGYCSGYKAPVFKGPVDIVFYITVDKFDFPTLEDVLARYLDFGAWPRYVEASGKNSIRYLNSTSLNPIEDDDGIVWRYYANYEIYAPVVGWQNVRTLSYNYEVPAYEGALSSLEYVAQSEGPQEVPPGEAELNGAVGIKDQRGGVHMLECPYLDLCDSSQHLMVYTMHVTPEIDILPSVAAKSIQEASEAIVLGMYFRSEDDGVQ